MVPITVALTSRFLRRARPERLASVGAVLVAVATVYIALSAGSEANYWLGYFPGTIVSGMGVGLASPNLMAAATHNLPPAQSSTGTGMSTMARQIGYVIGISMLFAIVGSMQALGPEVAFRTVLLVSVGVLLISSLTAFGVTTTRHATPAAPTRAPATPSPEEASEPTA